MRLASIGFFSILAVAGCIDLPGSSGNDDDLTSVGGDEYVIDYDGYVDVAPGAADDVVKSVIHRQLKSALGALREQGIGVADRDAVRNLANPTLVRQRVTVVQPGGAVRGDLDRVRYHYHDTALVEKGHGTTSPITLTLLYGDYISNAASLIPICSDDQTTDGDSLWYHYQPNISACKTAITAEQRAIDHDRESLTADTQIPASDADRKFLTTRATLVKATAAPDKWPEHDRLWGFAGDTSRTKLVVYSFFGVDSDVTNPGDNGIVEYMRFERELRKKLPKLAVTETSPNAWLLDFYVDGVKVPNVTWATVEGWIVDGTGFPASVANDPAKKADLLKQVITAFTDRWIVWSAPMTVTRNGVTRTMTLEIRTWHGLEDGSPDIRQHAQWRYLEAFWHSDVFAYTGHSHFGHGPLEPWEYSAANFPDRYQVMLFNSCLSFNYYDEDFLKMHPGGSQNVDVVVNGLPAYWSGMGAATAAYVVGITGGTQSYRQLLTGMRVNLGWINQYDPMRAVNGELDNAFTPTTGALSFAP